MRSVGRGAGCQWRSLAMLALAVAGCPRDLSGDDGGEDTVLIAQAVTCDPAIERYPIAAPHNGGYDRAWNNFTCAPHPGGSPDNSDYGGDHHGNDLFAPRGAPIVAVRAGRVTRSGEVSSISGLRVTIEDACGWSYYFGHLDSIAPGIGVGARVVAGQVIGTLGDTGTRGTAPHLHFNVHRDGNYSNDVDPYPLLRAADATACDPTATTPGVPPPQTCAPACEGASTLVSRDCGRGDCAAYGAGCVSDTLGPRCVFFACPALGEQDSCWLGRYIGHCRNGQLVSQGDCGAFGATCVQDGTSARCASPTCSRAGEYDTCLAGRYIGRCRDGVAQSPAGDCGAYGARCVDDSLGARCVFFACRPQGEHDACWLGRYRGRCFNGHLTAQADCGAQGGRCVEDDQGSRCVSTVCPATRGDVTFCVAPQRIGRCNDGMFIGYESDCAAAGSTCAQASATAARCVRAGDPPPVFDAGPPPAAVDAGPPPDLGFTLPDAWVPLPVDAALPPADVVIGVDLPPVADVPLPDDVVPFFVPDGGAMAAEVTNAFPPVEDDGKDPCAICRPLGRCPPQCDADGGASPADTGDGLVGPGCACRAGGRSSGGGGLPSVLVCALGLALMRRRTTSRRSRSRG